MKEGNRSGGKREGELVMRNGSCRLWLPQRYSRSLLRAMIFNKLLLAFEVPIEVCVGSFHVVADGDSA